MNDHPAQATQLRRHPAKYSDVILERMRPYLDAAAYPRVLDPFAGTGKLRLIRPDAYLLEIEAEWAAMSGATHGNAKDMPWPDGYFDAIATSPTYGNRMADKFEDRQPQKGYQRNTYRHALGRPLTPDNSGGMQWGTQYQDFHRQAWAECYRVLRPGGRMIVNVSDHIRKGQRVQVVRWHWKALHALGFRTVHILGVRTPRLRYGQNHQARVAGEILLVMAKPHERGDL
jgi:SAM-dependent methyltransferase